MTRIDLLANPMTTAEDLIVGGTSGAAERLAVGSEGDVLTVSAGVVAWDAPAGAGAVDYARVTRSTTQTISNATETPIEFDTEVEDTAGYHSTVSATSRFTVPSGKDGIFSVRGGVFWDNNATGQRQLYISKGGVGIPGSYQVQVGNTGFGVAQSTGAIVRLAATNYVELVVWQNSTANRTIGNSPLAAFEMVRLGS
jgi:hypothetical protein